MAREILFEGLTKDAILDLPSEQIEQLILLANRFFSAPELLAFWVNFNAVVMCSKSLLPRLKAEVRVCSLPFHSSLKDMRDCTH